MKKWQLIIFCLMAHSAKASMEDAHSEGSTFAEGQRVTAVLETQNKIDHDRVPGFTTDNPSQTSMNSNGNFQEAINNELKSSEGGKAIFESSEKRAQFKLDTKTDPLFSEPKISAENSLEIKEVAAKIEKDIPKIMTCEEGGEDVTYDCFQERSVNPQVPMKKITITLNYQHIARNAGCFKDALAYLNVNGEHVVEPTSFRQTICPYFLATDAISGQTFNVDCMRVQRYRMVGVPVKRWDSITDRFGSACTAVPYITVELDHDTYEGEGTDQWISYCDSLEEMVNQGQCRYGDKICTQGPETRDINGYKVYKDCWQYRQRYHCKMIKDDCTALRTKGCHQIASKCKESRQGRCWIFEQTYECPPDRVQRHHTEVSNIFCLTGNCQDASYQANDEMLDVVSRLAMLKEIQDDIRTQQSLGKFEIFKGSNQECNRHCVSFKDCCGGMRGWGMSLHLSNCSEDEKLLAKMREKNLCRFIGTYCAEKKLGVCIRKKTSFCCFGTKFSRLLQEQGRPQIGLDWGSPETPNCRGFTVEELSRIDFSKLDMSELFEEIMQKYRSPKLDSLQQKTTERIQDNIRKTESDVKVRTETPKTGAINDSKTF